MYFFTEKEAHIPLNRTECLSIAKTSKYVNDWFSISNVKVNKLSMTS